MYGTCWKIFSAHCTLVLRFILVSWPGLALLFWIKTHIGVWRKLYIWCVVCTAGYLPCSIFPSTDDSVIRLYRRWSCQSCSYWVSSFPSLIHVLFGRTGYVAVKMSLVSSCVEQILFRGLALDFLDPDCCFAYLLWAIAVLLPLIHILFDHLLC